MMKINVFHHIEKWLKKPKMVLIFCGILILFNVVLDGSLFQIRKLYLYQRELDKKTLEIQIKNQVILEKIKKLSDPKHLEQEVRNRFDLAEQGDLIFIFPEDEKQDF